MNAETKTYIIVVGVLVLALVSFALYVFFITGHFPIAENSTGEFIEA